jgi:predicted nucleic acid-binding protein
VLIVFLDTCAIIYWMEGAAPWSDRLHHRLTELHKIYGDSPVAVSALSRLECRVKPMRDNNTILLRRYNKFFNQSQLLVVPIDDQVLETATHLRAEAGIATPDAIQTASALCLTDEATFLTNDNRLKKVSGLSVITI